MSARPFCAEVSDGNAEPLAATASFVEHWILVEYRGVWNRQPLAGSSLSPTVKAHLRGHLDALQRCRLLFIRRPERRREAELACYFGVARERERRFHSVQLAGYDDLLAVDFAGTLAGSAPAPPTLGRPLFVVCTHGKRDRCCARYGRPLYDELRKQLEDGTVWQSTHVGGDRFAGNVVVFPEGLYFGRVGRADVGKVLAAYRSGRIHGARFRGRACYPFPVQAAERLVRAHAGLDAIDDVRLLSSERDGATWRVRLAAQGDVHEVDVVAELGEPAHLTCDAVSQQRPRRFATAGHRVRPG